jgi:parallel beta-helix repeat protein
MSTTELPEEAAPEAHGRQRDARDLRTPHTLVVLVVLALAVTATFAAGRAYRSLDDPAAGRPERPAFISAPDPVLRAEGGLDPNSTDEAPGLPRPDIRTIVVEPRQVSLVAGGAALRTFPVTDPATTPDRLADLIDDDAWIARTAPGEITLNAALVLEHDTTLTVAAPLQRLVLATRPGVFVGGSEATMQFTGVEVTAADGDVPAEGEVGTGSRPFVIAQGGTLRATGSTFRHLGRDWTGSYGVSWTKGATGGASGSTFEHGFMGIFAATAIDVRFTGNVLRGNTLYGLNAHQISAGVTVSGNTVEGNGRTGIMLSDAVTKGVVHDNTVRGNGQDGITLVDGSDGGTVTDNLVAHNAGDGVAVAGSDGVTVTGNTLLDNRVAIDVHSGSTGTAAYSNVIDENGAATQGTDPAGNIVLANGDHWRPWVLALIWALAVAIGGALVHLTRWVRRRTDQALAQRHPLRVPETTEVGR